MKFIEFSELEKIQIIVPAVKHMIVVYEVIFV